MDETSIIDFLSVGIIGAILSVIFQWIKLKFGLDSTKSKVAIAGLSLIVGTGYAFARKTVWWPTALGILASASTVYSLLLKPPIAENPPFTEKPVLEPKG